MSRDTILIKGAREHNLKNVDLTIPRDKFVVFTGVSGSGKSSLAFDTLYAEGQRAYVESLSAYARQFLGQMEKPDIDYIEGLSPAISIDQKTTSKNPRSTVGTVTEIYDYLRLLYARVGLVHCPVCGKEIRQQTIDQIIDRIMTMPEGTRLQILAPIIRGRKGEYLKLLDETRKSGYVRVRVDGSIYDLSEDIKIDKNKKHNIEVIIDRLVLRGDIKSRLSGSVETASKLSGGLTVVLIMSADGSVTDEIPFSQNYACEDHDISFGELEPRMFSFNNPYGACPDCTGLGNIMKIDPDLIIPHRHLSVRNGAIRASGWMVSDGGTIAQMYFEGLAAHYGFSLDTPVCELSDNAVNVLLYGSGGEKIKMTRTAEYGSGTYHAPWEGIINNLERRYKETNSDYMRSEIESCMSDVPCGSCGGARLKKETLAVTVGNLNIYEFCKMSITESLKFIETIKFTDREAMIAERIIKEIRERLNFLNSVGLEYLNLMRSSGTLSGGESQRIRLATQIGSSLMGVIYILDEPSIGLHQRDNDKLIATLKRLRDLGNTLIVVEHDEDTMFAADHVVDIGPGAGVHGGRIVAQGSVADICACEESLTGQYLSGKLLIEVPSVRRAGTGNKLTVFGAKENNLKNIDVEIPLGTFSAITGVSGSGKSSLVNEILYKSLASSLNGAKCRAGNHSHIDGVKYLDKVIDIDQSPIGRTPRSNPATYTGVFGDIRELFSLTPDSKMRGYTSGRFSFNVKGGRCEACSGDGIVKVEMHFLPDIYVPCDICGGKRYNRETLEVKYKGKNIYEVLEMTVGEAVEFFENVPKIKRKIAVLAEVGLTYIKLGHSATALSGGEAQRVKLATELSKRATGRTIYILDEPTTGLHTYDVHKLIEVLNTLVEGGNTVLVIEHNLDVIKTADYVVDLGPNGGDRGGTVVAVGTPEEIAACEDSYTGQYLKKVLQPFKQRLQ